MRVDMVLQRRQSLEPSLADRALVGPLFRVGLHVPREPVALGGGVVAVVAHVDLANLEGKGQGWKLEKSNRNKFSKF